MSVKRFGSFNFNYKPSLRLSRKLTVHVERSFVRWITELEGERSILT